MITNILLLILIFFLFILGYLVFKFDPDGSRGKRLSSAVERLNQLESNPQSNNYELRDKYVKLDNLLSKSLQKYYKNDLTCGENLKKRSFKFTKAEMNQIWEVHKLRNRIVHEDVEIDRTLYDNNYRIYRRFITKLLK